MGTRLHHSPSVRTAIGTPLSAPALSREGLRWWFEMDVSRIREHLEALPGGPGSRSPRLLLLQSTYTPLPTGRKLKTVLRDVTVLYRMLQAGRDPEGMAAAAVLAASAVWDFGTGFSLAEPWRKRLRSLATRRGVSPVARAALLAFDALFAIFHTGDLASARATLERQQEIAREAGSAALSLYGATLQALACTYAGELERAALVLEEAAPFFDRAEPTSHTRLYHRITQGLVRSAAGDPLGAITVLDAARRLLSPADMRHSMTLLLDAAHLLAASLAGQGADAELLARRVRNLAVADGVQFYAALMHTSAALGYLRSGRPYRALLHAESGERDGRTAESTVATAMNRLARALALVDLNETAEAFSALETLHAECRNGGLGLYRHAAALELADLCRARGETDPARRWLDEARAALPPGQPCHSPFRTTEFTARLLARLEPAGNRIHVAGAAAPIQIRALGEFHLIVNGQRLYDRRWGAGRTQRLLKLILALGGTRVSATRLIELLWPDVDGDRGHANLKTAVARLRAKGSPPGAPRLQWLHWKHGRISLSRSSVAADSVRFEEGVARCRLDGEAETLEPLLTLYRGEFLQGTDDAGEIEQRRAAVRDAHTWAVEKLLAVMLAAGRAGESLDLLGEAVRVNPAAEKLHVLKMQQQLAQGFPADALRTFREAVTILYSHGTAPGVQLQQLAHEAGLPAS